MTIPVDPGVYTDFRGLAELRRRASSDAPGESQDTLREVARQFEAVFVNMMLKSMREAGLSDGILDSEQIDQYQDMFDQQMALELAGGRGIGLADMLVRQLGGEVNPFVNRDTSSTVSGRVRPAPVTYDERGVGESRVGAGKDWAPAGPDEFVAGLWPHARRAAEQLGTRPEVLLAQAALESGWGRHVMPGSDGRSSNNLFGIKAGRQWEGRAAVVTTVEYENGVVQKTRARFRAYESPAESFDDYVRFLKENPRYAAMLGNAHDADTYAQGLQDAGYATDPEYAAKIMRILHSGQLQEAVNAAQIGATVSAADSRSASLVQRDRSSTGGEV